MKITEIQLYPVGVPRAYATQIASEGGGARDRVERSPFIFVEAKTDSGLTGWGEISDIEPPEFPDVDSLQENLSQFIVGRDPFDLQSLHADFKSTFPEAEGESLQRLTAAGLDMLCYDLQSQSASVPIYKLLGGAHRERVHVSWVAFIREDLGLLRDEIREKVAAGFTAFKLKVGVDIELDEARLAVLRETAGSDANIKIDPNGGWNRDEAVANIRRLAKYNISGVETPVAGRAPDDLATVRKQVDVPILEHVNTTEDALEYLRHDSLDYFNIATVGCGGIWPARVVAELAQSAGVGILLGSTVEMGPGTLGQLHLAASIRDLTLPSDLIGPAMYADDVLMAPLQYDAGYLHVPHTVGRGGEIDRAKLAELELQSL